MKIITVGSIKGGTGKTSVLILLARALAKSGCKDLLIDLDINDSLTSVLKPKNLSEIDVLENKHIAAALLSTKDDFADYIIPSNYPGIDLLRNHLQLSRVNFTQNLLKNKITVSGLADKYDYIIIDTPATYYALHIMAYQADVRQTVRHYRRQYTDVRHRVSERSQRLPPTVNAGCALYHGPVIFSLISGRQT